MNCSSQRLRRLSGQFERQFEKQFEKQFEGQFESEQFSTTPSFVLVKLPLNQTLPVLVPSPAVYIPSSLRLSSFGSFRFLNYTPPSLCAFALGDRYHSDDCISSILHVKPVEFLGRPRSLENPDMTSIPDFMYKE